MIPGSAAWLAKFRERGPVQFAAPLPLYEPPPHKPSYPVRQRPRVVHDGVPFTLTEFVGKGCPYCAIPMNVPSRDHILPRTAGGGNEPANIVIVCRPCNNDKGSVLIDDWIDSLEAALDPRAEIVRSWNQARIVGAPE